MVKQAVGSMSGGEKARLVLCMIVWQRPNLLLLDEPTNHLDLATREALSMALNEFEGTVMLVSHDRALLRAVCDEFWMVSKGGIAPFDGDLDDYQRYLLDEAKRQREEIKASTSKAAKSADKAANKATDDAADKSVGKASTGKVKNTANKSAPISDATRSLKRDLEKLEARMATLNTEGAALENRLSAPLPPQEIAELGQRLKTLNKELAQCEEQWLELSSQVEAATA